MKVMNPQNICIFFVADGFDRMNQELLKYLKNYNWFDFDLVKEQQTDEDWYIKTDKDADRKEFLRYNPDIYFHPEEKERLIRNNVVHLNKLPIWIRKIEEGLRHREGGLSPIHL